MASSLEDILARAKKRAKGNGTRPTKPPSGKSVWRILPGWRPGEPLLFYHDYGQHWIKDIDGNVKVVVGCPRATFEESCELCDAIYAAIKKAPNDTMREKLREMTATQQFLMNAVRTDVTDQRVEILTFGKQLFEALLNTIGEYDHLFDPTKGQDVAIERSGTGLNTSYSLTVRPADKCKPVLASLLSQRHDLDGYVRDDFAAKRDKAMAVLGPMMGGAGAGAIACSDPALTRAAAKAPLKAAAAAPAVADDEIGDLSDEELSAITDAEIVEDADAVIEATAATESTAPADFGADLSTDEDLEEFLRNI